MFLLKKIKEHKEDEMFLLKKIKEHKEKKKRQQFWKTIDVWQTEMYLYKLEQERNSKAKNNF